jgi:hypothetical protein
MPAYQPNGFHWKGIPLGKAGIHFENKITFVDSRWSLPRLGGAGMTNWDTSPELIFSLF